MAFPLYTPEAITVKDQMVTLPLAAMRERVGMMTVELRQAARAFGQAVDMAARGSGDVNQMTLLRVSYADTAQTVTITLNGANVAVQGSWRLPIILPPGR